MDCRRCLRPSARGPPASSPRSAAAAGRQAVRARALQPRVPGRARARRAELLREAAALTDAADAEALPRDARGRVHLERLLRQRRRLDGARRAHRADHRAVRGLRGRVVQLQGGVRGVHHACATTPRREKLARFSSELQEIENNLPIDPALRNPKLGALAPIRVVNEIFAAGDAQPRRADRRLQPAQRRARRHARRAPSA